MGGKAGKEGKGQNAPFEDPTTEQRYQRLLDQRRREGKPPISRARFSRQLTHTGGQRDPPTNVPNLRRSVDAPQTNPKSKARNTPAPPPARRQRTDYQQAERAQVEENSPSPAARPELHRHSRLRSPHLKLALRSHLCQQRLLQLRLRSPHLATKLRLTWSSNTWLGWD